MDPYKATTVGCEGNYTKFLTLASIAIFGGLKMELMVYMLW